MSVERVRAVFDKRRSNPYEPALTSVKGSYRFEIDGVGIFVVAVDGGNLEVTEGPRVADCVVHCGAAEFLDIASGRQNLLTAAMQGRIELSGDLSLAQKLHALMPAAVGSTGASAQRGAAP